MVVKRKRIFADELSAVKAAKKSPMVVMRDPERK